MKKYLIAILAICSLLLASCNTQRSAQPKRYQTLKEKAQVSLQLDEHEYSMSATVQVWRNNLVIVSLQPMFGIEMLRMEATQDSVVIVDKMNRRYTILQYDMFDKDIKPAPSYRMIQDFVTASKKPKAKTKAQIPFTLGKHKIMIQCSFSQREYNALAAPKRMDLKRYKQVGLREILPL